MARGRTRCCLIFSQSDKCFYPAIISHHKRNLHMFSTRTVLISKKNVAIYKKTNLLIHPSHTSSKTLMLQQTFLFFQNLNIYLSFFLITYNENKFGKYINIK